MSIFISKEEFAPALIKLIRDAMFEKDGLANDSSAESHIRRARNIINNNVFDHLEQAIKDGRLLDVIEFEI